ncbi:hypothetical protein GCM10028827_13340 [Mucilaginibacter myungsuensis]
MSMSAAESNKMFANMKFAPGIYDRNLKPIDSAEAIKMTRDYEYGIASRRLAEEGGLWYRVLMPTDTSRDAALKRDFTPRNAALQQGMLLDLKPFKGEIPESKIAGKAVVLIFWYPGFRGYPNGFAEHNDVISRYVGKEKFEVYAVTKYSRQRAFDALRTTPILNAHHIFDATDLLAIYAPDDRPLIIVTDKNHKITYSVTNNLGITPRILNGLLKAL